MSKLLDYLNHLDKDAAAREAFSKTPHDAMEKFGLNDAERQALLSGDKTAIAKLAGIDECELPVPQIPNVDYDDTP